MSIELVNKFFDFGTSEFERLDRQIRFNIFKEVAQSDLDGLIFTIVWDYDFKEDEDYIDDIIEIFEAVDAQICLIELQANLSERLKRNKNEDRLRLKPSKQDLEMSEKSLLYFEDNYRMESKNGEFVNKPILTIDNTQVPAQEVAQMIKERFRL